MSLTALAIKNAKPTDKPRKLADEKGLFLLINPNGSKYWRLKYRIDGKEKLLAIGVYCGPTQYDDSGKAKTDKIQLSLTEARDLAYEAREQIKDGIDPNQAKRQVKQQAIFDAENCFEAVAREWHTRSAARWSADHAARIMRRLEVELFPTLGKRSVNELKTRDLLMALRPIEERGHLDVASRLQQYITAISFGEKKLMQTDPRILFGRRLAQLRRQKGWSQEKLALENGIARSYLGGVERGQRNIALINICKLAETLDVPAKDLLDFDPL